MLSKPEPIYKTYAKRILDLDELPQSLEDKLSMADQMVKKVQPGACLCSKQCVAIIILQWELEQTLEKFELKHQDANY